MRTRTHTKTRTKALAPRRKTGRPAELDRDKLLDAAEALFADKGFDGATTRELAKRARCNSALISYHFGSKQGLYQAIMMRHLERVGSRYSSAGRSAEELARLWPELEDSAHRQFCTAFFELASGLTSNAAMQKILCREMMTGAAEFAAVLARSENNAYRLLLGRLVELQKSGRIRRDLDLRFAVVGLVGPVVYSCIATPILRQVYGFRAIDEAYLRGLCLHQTRVFFEGSRA